MSVVLDCSATLAFVLGHERSDEIVSLFDQVAMQGAVVPTLWHLEVANSLLVATRRKRIGDDFRNAALADLSVFDIATDTETHLHAWSASIQLASRMGLTVYGAAYLELAQRRRLPLATLDAALAKAALAVGIPVVPQAPL